MIEIIQVVSKMGNNVCRSKKQLRRIYKKRVYYFCIAVILCVCLVQFLYSSLYNFTKYIVLNRQENRLEELNSMAIRKNEQLKNQLEVYSSCKGIEELARNNLKMVGKDEVLVLIREQAQ